jgi:hypothetical protein
MLRIFKILFLVIFQLMVVCSIAQEGTRNTGAATAPIGKIMLIPFEPRLYMSEIDMKINQQTQWKFEKIRENFRKQLNAQLKTKLQSIAPVVSFYGDSAKMAKDLAYIYRSTSLRYDLLSDPTPAKPQPKESGIKNGQLVVIANTDKKFMNTQIIDKELLPYLTNKYKTDYFVFINQLDIVNNNETYSLATDTYMRDVTVHYSILDKTGKCISAGVATSQFSSKENEPKKIVSLSFSPIASYITGKLSSFLKPEKEAVKPKK